VFFLRDEANMIEVKWQLKTPPRKVLRTLCAAATQVRAALLEEWEQKVVVTTPGDES
jgi:hypothetical protein